jgi:hypothetical protein
MPIDREARKAEQTARQAAYDNFRYTDAQRRQVLEFIEAANRVIRGEAKWESLKRLLPVKRIDRAQDPSDGASHAFDARFMNEWSGIYVNIAHETDGAQASQPVLFEVNFAPSMTGIPREQLEQLLKLKVVHGWTGDGGNLLAPGPLMHGGGAIPKWAAFNYGPIDQPSRDFNIEVELLYLGAPDNSQRGLYAANILSQVKIRRNYLSPEQIRERDHKRFGHLPQSLQRCTKSGRYIPHFANDELTRIARQDNKVVSFPEGSVLGKVAFWNSQLRDYEYIPAWWEWIGPDRFAHLM